MEGFKAFFDTNILVYAFSSTDAEKQKIALSLLEKSNRTISTQVIKELSSFLISKTDLRLDLIRDKIMNLSNVMTISDENSDLIYSAFDIHNVYKFSFYDCLIIAAALKSNCEVLYTEDMQDGQLLFKSLKVVNPFIADR